MPDSRQNDSTSPSAAPSAMSVSELTVEIKDLLEAGFPSVWVEGEISNFSRPQSGHCYFTLKDDRAQIRAVIWRGAAARLRYELGDGIEMLCQGHLDVYAPRGSYQLVVDRVIPKGLGALEAALKKLRDKLAREGLFDPERKRPIPKFPRTIGVVTSPTGAAIRDFLEVLRRRWTDVRVLVFPTRVQGDGAADEIAAAIRSANCIQPPLDVLVVGRGGGSLEDLWAFNEEPVIRAIAASKIPTVSAVGHEIDVTLADMAADVRALTPSEAAERIVPSGDEVVAWLRATDQRLSVAMQRRVQMARARLDAVAASRLFRRPLDVVNELSRRADEFGDRAHRAIKHHLQNTRRRVDLLAGKLDTLSPLGVLGRGYSLTTRAGHNQVIRDASELSAGDRLRIRFARGEAISQVEQIQRREDK